MQVVEDIFLQLKLKKPVAKFKASCFRSNLFYDVRFKDALEDPFEELRDFVVEALGDNWEENRTVSGLGNLISCPKNGTKILLLIFSSCVNIFPTIFCMPAPS